jgi:uncharacterized damage-inducible protein DinB
VAIKDALLPELDQEAAATRRMLERLPEDKLDWKPAEKSMTLSRLATHLAELPMWGHQTLITDELDINPPGGEPYVGEQLTSVPEILEKFDANVEKLRDALASTDDEAIMQPWTLKAAGQDVFTLPRIGVIRGMVMNHVIHHRGQLSVYLRLLDVPLPATYGPSADDTMGMR